MIETEEEIKKQSEQSLLNNRAMESTYGSSHGRSQDGPSYKKEQKKYDFVVVRNFVNDFLGEDVEKKILALQELLKLIEKYPELCIELNDETNLRNALIDALKTNPAPNLKELIDRILPRLNNFVTEIPSGATSFLDKFRPILLQPKYQEFINGSHIVKLNHPGQVVVPFDPVFTSPNAPVRPILIDKIKSKDVDKELLKATYTVNARIVYCKILFQIDKVMNDNVIILRLGVIDADLPMVQSSSFVPGKAKGGVSFDTQGAFWINGNSGDIKEPESKWTRNQEIGMEADLNANPRTLRFFVDKVQCKNYISNIPARFRFFASPSLEGDWFQVKSLSVQQNPIGQLRAGDNELRVEDSQYDYTEGM